MLIGLDFDNTIVCYDQLFHKVAVEKKLIPVTVPPNKIAVRNYLRSINKEEIWTEMQGYVYGERMQEAEPFSGVLNFIQKSKESGHQLCIISHKTQFPFLGPKYDLHLSAIEWIQTKLCSKTGEPLFLENEYFFKVSKDEKVKQIKDCGCDIYVDDLPEILMNDLFPKSTIKFLFDPELHYSQIDYPQFKVNFSWDQITNELFL
jgi:hypothetical protein